MIENLIRDINNLPSTPSFLADNDINTLLGIIIKGSKVICTIFGEYSHLGYELLRYPLLIRHSEPESSSYQDAWVTDINNLKIFFETMLKDLKSNESQNEPPNEYQIFISHTQKDQHLCDFFDRIVARVGIKAFRSEFEDIPRPSWKTIKEAMSCSVALFFLVGEELVKNQDVNYPEWRHTQNWIAYEIGLACQLGLDVWVICDKNVLINFPLPYLNNHFTGDLEHDATLHYLKYILEMYKGGMGSINDVIGNELNVKCLHEDCKIEFALHQEVPIGGEIVCPQCLRSISFPKGHMAHLIEDNI